MSKANLLILAEQSKVFTPYKLILNSYFNEIETLLIDNNLFLANRQLKKFDLILIDLSTKKFIENLDDFLRLYIKNSKFIFIIPFEISNKVRAIDLHRAVTEIIARLVSFCLCMNHAIRMPTRGRIGIEPAPFGEIETLE